MFQITFKFENGDDVIVHALQGENLLEVARKANVAIDAPCSGNASCGKCRVKLLTGELESQQTRHITDEEYASGYRLACVSKIVGDVSVEVPDIASAYKSRMKVADLSSPEEIAIFEKTKSQIVDSGIQMVNDLSVVEVQMDEPTLDDTMPDNERLTRALQEAGGVEKVTLPYFVIKKLPDVLRDSHFHVKCVVKKNKHGFYVRDAEHGQQR